MVQPEEPDTQRDGTAEAGMVGKWLKLLNFPCLKALSLHPASHIHKAYGTGTVIPDV